MLTRALALLLLMSSAHIVQAGEVAVVTTRVVYPGERVGAELVEEVPLERGNRKLGPIFQRSADIIGQVAKRTILPGRLIPQNSVRPAYLVERGQPIEVTYATGGLVISIVAMPLDPGAAGDKVKLRNIESGRIFSGQVMADGTVKVTDS